MGGKLTQRHDTTQKLWQAGRQGNNESDAGKSRVEWMGEWDGSFVHLILISELCHNHLMCATIIIIIILLQTN